jgi:hypothetical protein
MQMANTLKTEVGNRNFLPISFCRGCTRGVLYRVIQYYLS